MVADGPLENAMQVGQQLVYRPRSENLLNDEPLPKRVDPPVRDV